MKRKQTLAALLLFVLVLSTAIGCDNRSQMEKDADKAMKKLDGALK